MPMRKYDLNEYCWQCPQMQEKEEALIKGYCKCPFPDKEEEKKEDKKDGK